MHKENKLHADTLLTKKIWFAFECTIYDLKSLTFITFSDFNMKKR